MRHFSTADNLLFWEKNRSDYFADAVARPLVRLTYPYIGRNVLDAGAGSGSLVRELRRRFQKAKVVGLDLAPKSTELIQADLARVPFSDDIFDTVFCTEVLEHLDTETLHSVLTEFTRVLRPGGFLICTTPYREDLHQETVICPRCGEEFHRYGHQQTFDETTTVALLKQFAFDPEYVVPIKMRRLQRYQFAAFLFRSRLYQRLPWKGRGTLQLVCVVRKRIL